MIVFDRRVSVFPLFYVCNIQIYTSLVFFFCAWNSDNLDLNYMSFFSVYHSCLSQFSNKEFEFII